MVKCRTATYVPERVVAVGGAVAVSAAAGVYHAPGTLTPHAIRQPPATVTVGSALPTLPALMEPTATGERASACGSTAWQWWQLVAQPATCC